MHSLLENYLSEVEAQLVALPVKQRGEELREMRAHLENASVVNRERGQSEEEAVQSTVAQFGTPKDLGENVIWVWRRGVAQDRRCFLGAAITTTLMLYLGFEARGLGLLNSIGILPQTFLNYLGEHSDGVMDPTEVMIIMIFGLAGMAAGCLFPKRAVRGACLGLAFYQLGSLAVFGLGYGGVWRFLSLTFGWSLAAIISAWAGSHLRLTWRKRRRLAQV